MRRDWLLTRARHSAIYHTRPVHIRGVPMPVALSSNAYAPIAVLDEEETEETFVWLCHALSCLEQPVGRIVAIADLVGELLHLTSDPAMAGSAIENASDYLDSREWEGKPQSFTIRPFSGQELLDRAIQRHRSLTVPPE